MRIHFIAAAALAGLSAACTEPVATSSVAPAASAGIDIATVAMPSERPRADIADDYARSREKAAYTLAMSADGRWGSQDRTRNRTAEDRRRNALQKCEHVAGSPCGLVIDNGVVVQGFAPTPSGLVHGGRFDPATVPFVTAASRGAIATEYAGRRGDRALAVHRNGAWDYEWGQPGPDAAVAGALRRCAEFSESGDCFVHDVNGQVRFARDTPLRNPG